MWLGCAERECGGAGATYLQPPLDGQRKCHHRLHPRLGVAARLWLLLELVKEHGVQLARERHEPLHLVSVVRIAQLPLPVSASAELVNSGLHLPIYLRRRVDQPLHARGALRGSRRLRLATA